MKLVFEKKYPPFDDVVNPPFDVVNPFDDSFDKRFPFMMDIGGRVNSYIVEDRYILSTVPIKDDPINMKYLTTLVINNDLSIVFDDEIFLNYKYKKIISKKKKASPKKKVSPKKKSSTKKNASPKKKKASPKKSS